MNKSLYGIFAILLWSTTVGLGRSLSEQLGPIRAAGAVFFAAGAVSCIPLLLSGRAFERVKRIPRLYLLGCGALFLLYQLSLFLAIGMARDRAQVLEVGLINYLWPGLTILFSLLLLGKRATWFLLPGTALAFGGEFLVLSQGRTFSAGEMSLNLRGNPAAYTFALVAAISWGLYSNLARRWAGPKSDEGASLFMLGTGVAFSILGLGGDGGSMWTGHVLTEVLFLGLATAVSYVLWDIAMRKGDVVLVAAFSYFTPLFSTLVSSMYLEVEAGLHLWLGCLFIITGSLISWRSVSDRTQE